MPKQLTLLDAKQLVSKLFVKHSHEAQELDRLRALDKKALKETINKMGGFTKMKLSLDVDLNSFTAPGDPDNLKIPEGATPFEAILSDENVNMNGYRIRLSAWSQGFEKYFKDFGGLIYESHDMDKSIGKTLAIWVDEETKQLKARGYVFDDLTNNRVSRDLLVDISTGHIALEIMYENDETSESLTPAEFEELLRNMIEHMWVDDKTREEIKEAIAQVRELWIETHTLVQIVEYSFVTVGSVRSAEITKKNTIEKIDEELPEDVELVIEKEGEEEEIEDPNAPNKVEQEGENPEGNEDTPPASPEIVDETEENKKLVEENNQLKADIVELTTNNTALQSEVEELKQSKETLTNDLKKIEDHQVNKKVILNIDNNDVDKKKNDINMKNEINKVKHLLTKGY